MRTQPAKGPGDDVRATGSDIATGEVVLAKGSLIGAAEIGLLATVGAANVKVVIFPLKEKKLHYGTGNCE